MPLSCSARECKSSGGTLEDGDVAETALSVATAAGDECCCPDPTSGEALLWLPAPAHEESTQDDDEEHPEDPASPLPPSTPNISSILWALRNMSLWTCVDLLDRGVGGVIGVEERQGTTIFLRM